MRKALLGALLIANAGAVAACGSAGGGGTTNNSGPIVIGATASKTGAYASSGQNVAAGYQLAVDQINSGGGLLGRKVKLILEDDTSDAGTVVRLYTRFLTEDKVDALLSPYGSALAKPAAEQADRYKTPMVHSLTSSPAVFENTTYNVDGGIPPGPALLAALPSFAKEHGYQKLALIANDLEAFGLICKGVNDAAQSSGLTVVSDHYAPTTADFSSIALKTKQANPDVVVMCGAIQDSVGLARTLNQQGFRPKMLVSDISQQPSFSASLGPLANKVVGYTTWSSKFQTAGNAQFVQAYQTSFKAEPNDLVANAFSAVQVLTAMMKQAGTTDKAKVNQLLHQKTFETVMGTYQVDKNGEQIGFKPSLTQLIDGQLQLIYPPKVATAPAQLPY